METWYPAAVRDALGSSGDYAADDAVWRGVLHTTEGKTYASAKSAYASVKNPHFTVSYEHGKFECFQHLPINQFAKALKNAPGGVETNREHAVQIEIVGTANPGSRTSLLYVEDFPAEYLAGIAALMRWIEAQTGIKPVAPVEFKAYPASYGADNGVRMTGERWLGFNGWCGHQHVPENDHGDPGAIPIQHLLPVPDLGGGKGNSAPIGPATPPAPKPAPKPAPAHVGPWWYGRVLRAQSPVLHGDDVKHVQRKVGVRVDGEYGPLTAKAVEMWQRSHHVYPIDGVVGSTTATALDK